MLFSLVPEEGLYTRGVSDPEEGILVIKFKRKSLHFSDPTRSGLKALRQEIGRGLLVLIPKGGVDGVRSRERR